MKKLIMEATATDVVPDIISWLLFLI